MSQFLGKIKNVTDKITTKIKTKVAKTGFNRLLSKATSNDTWYPLTKHLEEIARHTYNDQDYELIMKTIWRKLQPKKKKIRRTQKALQLLEYLIKMGSERCTIDAKGQLYKITELKEYSEIHNGVEQALPIREKAKTVEKLLTNSTHLDQERKLAHKIRASISTGGTGEKLEEISTKTRKGQYNKVSNVDFNDFGRFEEYYPQEIQDKGNEKHFANQPTKEACVEEVTKPEKPVVEEVEPEPLSVESSQEEEATEEPTKKREVEDLMSFDDEPQAGPNTEVQQPNFENDAFQWVNPSKQTRICNEINPNLSQSNNSMPLDPKEAQKQTRIQVIDDAFGSYHIQPKIIYNNPYGVNTGGFGPNPLKENIITFSNYGGMGQMNGGYYQQNYQNNFYRNNGNANGFY